MTTSSAEHLSKEIESLKKDIGRLHKDLASLLESAGSNSKDKLMESREKLRAALDSLKDQVSQKATDAYESIKDHSGQALDKGRHTIEEKPVTAVLVAFFAGAIFGMFSHKYKE